MSTEHADAIVKWVKEGGVLILLANDAGNADLKYFNLLATRFGIRFRDDNYNLVENNQFEQGLIIVPGENSVFRNARNLFIKELATLEVKKPATVLLQKEGKNIMATAKYGKGAVFALGDPWLYNEYIDGRKLPASFHNHQAAVDLVRWALKKSKKK
jgi:unsaturated rhamnogalacturonyl hydrolase